MVHPLSISIESDVNIEYSAFVLEGLRLSGASFRFAPTFRVPAPQYSLAVIDIISGRRAVFDTGDRAVIDDRLLDWCDGYWVTNYDPTWLSDTRFSKVKPLGPTFGINGWGSQTARDAIIAASREVSVLGLRRKAAQTWRMAMQRRPIDDLKPVSAPGTSIHFYGRAWSKHTETIAPRVAFLEGCELAGHPAIGGLIVDTGCQRVPERFRLPRPIPYRDYLNALSTSLLAFNAPAVHGCLGWKLGEFLAMGLPIISLPLGRELPSPLQHGVNVHFVDGSKSSIAAAIKEISSNEDYRRRLAVGARAYFDAFVHPRAMISSAFKAMT